MTIWKIGLLDHNRASRYNIATDSKSPCKIKSYFIKGKYNSPPKQTNKTNKNLTTIKKKQGMYLGDCLIQMTLNYKRLIDTGFLFIIPITA